MKEKDSIQKRAGTENAFKVPDGYFENLTSDIMNKLPEKDHLEAETAVPTMWAKLKPFLYMAAMFVGAALIIRVASSTHQPIADEGHAEMLDTEMVSEQMINTAVDGAMMDDYSLYVYLCDTDAE